MTEDINLAAIDNDVRRFEEAVNAGVNELAYAWTSCSLQFLKICKNKKKIKT